CQFLLDLLQLLPYLVHLGIALGRFSLHRRRWLSHFNLTEVGLVYVERISDRSFQVAHPVTLSATATASGSIARIYCHERSPTMDERKTNDEGSVEAGRADARDAGLSRRELLVKGGKVVAGIGVASLLGNLGNWALSYAADKEPIKIGILHSLS